MELRDLYFGDEMEQVESRRAQGIYDRHQWKIIRSEGAEEGDAGREIMLKIIFLFIYFLYFRYVHAVKDDGTGYIHVKSVRKY
jgi:hypothetical protein